MAQRSSGTDFNFSFRSLNPGNKPTNTAPVESLMTLSTPGRQKLAREYGIGPKSKEKWPECYKELFRNAQRLADKRLDSWEEEFKDDDHGSSEIKKWRDRTKDRVLHLAKTVQRLVEGRQERSETDWRGLESTFFEHLSHKENCSKCSQRIWISYQEIDAKSMSPNKALGNRQKRRKLCVCNSQPSKEPSTIFGSRSEATVTYDRPLKSAMQKKYERPDLFYGVLQKGRVLEYLRALPKNSTVRTTPFANKNTECVFPFLVVEAKAGKSATTQGDIILQMGFAVRETLLAQQSLAFAVNSENHAFEPLVWCITYHGENISIKVACLDWRKGNGDEGGYGTNLMHIWSGILSDEDDAFRCLLIIDYIADWARDVYRENIIKQLKLVASMTRKPAVPGSPANTVVSYDENDEDIDTEMRLAVPHIQAEIRKSRLPRREAPMQHNSGGSSDDSSRDWTLLESPTRGKNTRLEENRVHRGIRAVSEDKMRRFDVATYAYRDARYIRSRVMGLCITSESVQDLFNSRVQDSAEKLFARIAVQLQKHQLAQMKGSTLIAMEQAWSGTNNQDVQKPHGAETFYVSFTFSAYLSPDWEQTRELCYIAVSKGVLDTIKRHRRLETKLAMYEVNHARALRMVEIFQKVSVSSNLSACLQRCSIRPIYSDTYETQELDDIFPKHYNMEPIWMKPDMRRKTRDIVWSLYKPIVSEGENYSRSYLRLQSAMDVQTRPKKATRQSNKSPWIPSLLQEKENFILSYDENPDGLKQERRPEWCLFWANPDPLEPSKWISKLQKLRLELVYTTSRLGVGKNWQKIIWNETDLGITGFNKVNSENCLDTLCSALAKEEQNIASSSPETDINYALSQLQIHSNPSTPRRRRLKSRNEVRVEEIDDEYSDTESKRAKGRRAGNPQPSNSREDDVGHSNSEDEHLENVDLSIREENQQWTSPLYSPRSRSSGLLTKNYYMKRRNAA